MQGHDGPFHRMFPGTGPCGAVAAGQIGAAATGPHLEFLIQALIKISSKSCLSCLFCNFSLSEKKSLVLSPCRVSVMPLFLQEGSDDPFNNL